jgi:4-amino-4-deoxy-L-arabinose transferase-like glycosyltransferase
MGELNQEAGPRARSPATFSAPGSRTRQVALPALLGLAVTVVLVAVAGRYGYHRDEFYYLASGLHPAFGYVDQPPLTPLIARAEDELFGDSAVALRLVPALATGLTVLVTAVVAGELGAGRAARALAAACVAVAAFPVGTGHVLSTSTFDLLAWTVLSWLMLRGLRRGGPVWLAAGAVAGLALENKTLVVGLLGAVGCGVLAVGPRGAVRDRWLWAGLLLAVALWAPNLIWQAGHGWPAVSMADRIATVGNGGSQPRWLFPVFQLVLISPLLTPVWLSGLWALARDPALRWARAFAVAYGVLFVALLAVGGKPYYLAGMYPVLLAAGAEPTLRWVRRGAEGRPGRRARAGGLAAALVLSAAATAVLTLPVVPARLLPGSPIVAVQPIAADTVGWPEYATTVAAVYRSLPPEQRVDTVALTANYGEAGALDLFRRRGMDLPPAYSGHNAYADWGPPPESATTVIAVGFDEPRLRRWFASVQPAARVDNGIGLANEEQGRLVWICTGRRDSWARLWPELRHLD